ncbi:MAG: radical SAM protein [Syntrophobacteraceae bacterium]|nr:radical SAM protein [Syntrophobacteraceae bacterium]
MRILLLQAVSTHDCGEMVFPLGLAKLAAVIGRDHEVRGIDLNFDPFPWPALASELEAFRPDVAAVSFRNLDPLAGNLISFIPHLKTLGAILRRRAPQAVIVVGGSAFTLFSRRIMEEVPEADIGVAGEAETVFPKLLENLGDPGAIPGVLWRNKGLLESSKARISHCMDMDCLPFPDWQIFQPRRYGNQNRYVAYMGVETKRGCANNCSYCLYPVLQGRSVRLRSPERIAEEIEILRRDFGVKNVHFTDAVVNEPPGHLEAVCEEILRRGLDVGWTGFFREDALSEKSLDLYRRSGLITLYFSADGACDQALKVLGKDLSVEQILEAARLAARSGVLTVYHFLVNLPGENEDSVQKSRELLEKLFSLHDPAGNLGAVVVNNLRLYPGTPLTERILRERLIEPELDLLYPTYFNPPPWDNLRHELAAFCMRRGVESYLENETVGQKEWENARSTP